MSKNYILQFGSTTWTGLSPTFSVFKVVPGGGNTTPPGVTEIPTTSGLYYFTYEPATSMAFLIDGGSSLAIVGRYIAGALDPVQAVDERIQEQGTTLIATGATLVAIGNSLLAMGSTLNANLGASLIALIGTTASSFGGTLTDPATVFGFLKRLQEFNEGNSVFYKTSGLWDIYARGNAVGASTQLAEKSLVDSGSVVTKA